MTMHPRTIRLKQLMAEHSKTCDQVSAMIHCKPQTIRTWRIESKGKVIPECELELLEMKLNAQIS